jgi:hypothetical protein
MRILLDRRALPIRHIARVTYDDGAEHFVDKVVAAQLSLQVGASGSVGHLILHL